MANLSHHGQVADELDLTASAVAPQLKKQLIGVEAMDHPTAGELLDHARRFFKAADKMTSRQDTEPS